MLTSPSYTSENPFQNNKSYKSIGNLKNMYPLAFAIDTERLLWNHSLLRIRTINGGISWYVLALLCLLYFTACLFFLFFFFFFFFVESNTWWAIQVSWSILKIKQESCS